MKTNRVLLSLLAITLIPLRAPADHIWSRRVGTGNCAVSAIALDPGGNIVVTGGFLGTGNFGGDPLPNAGNYDFFLAKYDPNGNHIWSRAFGSLDHDGGSGVSVSSTGDIFVTGEFGGAMTIGLDGLAHSGSSDIFLAKFNADGNPTWADAYGSSDYDYGTSVATDASGNVIMTGRYALTVDFGGGPLIGSGSAGDIFIAEYKGSGSHLWSKRFGWGSSDWGQKVAVDESNNVLLGGFFYSNVDFGGGPLANAGYGDIFLVKYTPSGVHLWSRSFGSTWDDYLSEICLDDEHGIVLVGRFTNPINMGGLPLVSAGATDVFLARYDHGGNHLWSKRFGGPSYDRGNAVSMDNDGNIAVTGNFFQTVDFGGGPLTSNGNDDGYAVLFNPSGDHIWSVAFGDIYNDTGWALSFTNPDRVLFGGSVLGSVNFGGPTPIQSGGFLAQFHGVEQPTEVGQIAAPALQLHAFPNPFNPGTSITITASQSDPVRVTIHDVNGGLVRNLYSGTLPRGTIRLEWDGRDDRGLRVSSGVYFCRALSPRAASTSKLTVLK